MAARDPQGSWSPVKTFIKLNNDYAKERDLAGAWAGKYEPLIEAHFDAAESYERAQLIAEIGIVLASLAVLLASRLAWLLSVLVAVGCIVQLGGAWVHTRQVVEQSEVQVQRAEEAFGEVRKAHLGADEDKQIVERLDPDGNIRQEIEADTKKAEPAPMRTAAEKH